MDRPLPPPPDPTPPSDEESDAAFVGGRPKLESKVRIVDYDPRWPELFEREAERIRTVLGDRVLALDHAGSTSVPGLAAKPIIDIDLSVADSSDEPAWLPDLEAAGYRLVIREPDWEQHRALKGPDTDVNLHVWTLGGDEPARHLLFRDWLRSHPDDLALYAETKREVAKTPWRYIADYNAAKAPVIHEIYARIVASHGGDSTDAAD